MLQTTKLLALAIFLTACQPTTNRSVSYKEIERASLTLLKQAILIESVCLYGNEQTPVSSPAPYQQWLTNNWPLLSGADAFYSASLRSSTRQYEGIRFSPTAINFFNQQRNSAIKRSKQRYGRLNSSACEQTLAGVNSKTSFSEDVTNALTDYSREHPSPPAIGERLPTLAVDLSAESKIPGRSHFEIEQLSRTLECTQPQIITLKNRWPEEAYAVVCSGLQLTVTCEWGNCKTND